ncbi:MAG: hypothetical protein QW350_05305 [Candidatus Aenigmatarchaeota archaeon]|jgi:hypothetical protein
MELANISSLQRSIHFPSKENPDEEIESRFFYHPRKISWTSNIELSLTMVREGSSYVYVADPNIHLLINSVLIWKIPTIKVKEEFKETVQIAWPENLGFVLIKEAGLFFGDIRVQTLDTTWLCIYYQLLDRRHSKRSFLYHMIGNRKELTEWSTSLVGTTVIVPQPWYYTESEVFAVPLFYCQQKQLKHKYFFRNKISEIIRMRVKKDETWKELSEPIMNYIEYNEDILAPPEMIGKYVQLTQQEFDFRNKDHLVFYIRDIVRWNDEVPKTFSDSVSVDIQTLQPCQSIFFVAENVESFKNRNFTKFCTSDGKNPFSSAKLIYGTNEKIPEREIDFFSYIEPYFYFPCVPDNPGFNAISFCYDLTSVDPDVGITFKSLSAKLVLRLCESEKGIRELFKVKVYFLVMKKIEIEYGNCIVSEGWLKTEI